MFDTKFIDDAVKRLSESLPPGLNKFKKDLEKNFRAILQSMFARVRFLSFILFCKFFIFVVIFFLFLIYKTIINKNKKKKSFNKNPY